MLWIWQNNNNFKRWHLLHLKEDEEQVFIEVNNNNNRTIWTVLTNG